METRYDIQTMVEVARLYYTHGMTQEKIARQQGVSRSAISMILSEARDFGIVDIKIKNPQINNEEASRQMLKTFGLSKCYVVPVSPKLQRILTKIIASQGAGVVDQEIKSHTSFGVAWGTTCYECMSAYRNEKNHSDVNVVPLIGGTNRIASEYQLNEMVRMMAEKLQGLPNLIFAPAVAETPADKQLYMKSATMKHIIEKWKSLDTALVSVGAPPGYFDSSLKSFSDETTGSIRFEADRPIGDICARQFNINGEFLDNEYNENIIGISESALRKTGKVICVAAGEHKVVSILGALRSRIIDILVTDEATAFGVLEAQNRI